MSPFRALYGQDPLLFKGTTVLSKIEEIDQLQELHENLLRV